MPAAAHDDNPAAAPATPPSPPPHLAELTLAAMRADEFDAFHRVIDRGFHEDTPAEVRERHRVLVDPDRHFGFRAGERWVSTFGSFPRRLTVPGGASVPVSAVSAVTVHTAFRRRGLLRQMMAHEFSLARSRGEVAAALYASESGIYGRFGYGSAAPTATLAGRSSAVTLRRDVAGWMSAAGGSVDEVDRDRYLAMVGPVHERLGRRRPGALDRPANWWALAVGDPVSQRRGATPLRFVVSFDADGRVDGHARYRVRGEWATADPTATAEIDEVEAETPTAWARLWAYLTSLDLVQSFSVDRAAVDDPLPHLVTDPRAVSTRLNDAVYLRLLDVTAALSARRYAAPTELVLRVRDDTVPDCAGRYLLRGGPAGATADRTDREPDLSLDVRELSAAYLGGVSLGTLGAAGWIDEHRPGALAEASTAFGWPDAPFCADQF